MEKKLMLLTLPLILLTSCGDDEPLGELFNDIDEQFTESVEIQEKWAADCRESQLLNTSVRRMIEFNDDNFSEEYLVYSDSTCETSQGIVKLRGEFEINGGDDIKELNLNYQELAITANSQVAVDIFSAVNLCGVDEWVVNQETVIAGPQGDNCFLTSLPSTKYGLVSVDDSEDKMFLSESFSDASEDRPNDLNRSVEYNEVED